MRTISTHRRQWTNAGILISRLLVSVYVSLMTDALPTLAQLNEHCTVSVLNRTAQVQPDGTWVLPNVPANFGQVRARATCIENGITSSGQSDFFLIPANNSVDVPQVTLGTAAPIATSLSLTAPNTVLSAIGATLQLSVVATFADGSTTDVTPGSTGTNYTVSNPTLVTISPDGLATAVASGTVLISAMHEGVLGIMQHQVVLSGDSDGDGIPDDVEVANGLNPNNLVDGLEDIDRDGLSAKQELVDFGTNFQVADTDGDSIPDGEEVMPGADGFVTNPLLADTDGDGLHDALEIATSSDPTDPGSLNLSQALVSLEITPPIFVLTFNTLVGDASRQFTVTGQLLDDTSIDLTSTTTGTHYTSSNLTVCNFGVPDGRVFAGVDGSCTITVRNSGFSVKALGQVQTLPMALSFLDLPAFANNVDVAGNVAYVAGGPAGLHVVDVANRMQPTLLTTLPLSGNANDVKVYGTLVLIAGGSSGLHIVDVTQPEQPALLVTVDTPGDAIDLAVTGEVVYVADGPTGVQVIDINSATLIGSLSTSGMANGLDVAQTLLVVSVFDQPIEILDVSNPSAPQRLSVLDLGTNVVSFDVQLIPPFAYVATSNGIRVVDATNPSLPQFGGAFGESVWMTDVVQANENLLFTTHVRPDTPMPIFTIDDLAAPSFMRDLLFSAYPNNPAARKVIKAQAKCRKAK